MSQSIVVQAWLGRGLRLAAALASAVYVNHRQNIVAADAAVPACLSELLIIKELSSVAVTAREPADRRSSVGFLHGIDGDLTDSELTAGLALTVPILAASKEGMTVRSRLTCSQPPDRITLGDLQLRVWHARPCLLQCRQCGRFGHVSERCLRAGACIRCGHQHPAATTGRPRSVSCGGGHPADTLTCPHWQEERRVATLLAIAPTLLSRRAVRAAVCKEYQGVRSYAAAVTANLTESPTKDPACSARLQRRADPSCCRPPTCQHGIFFRMEEKGKDELRARHF
ncbi:hypothetical protein MRX96_007240 [Rhipicephalus microplus]